MTKEITHYLYVDVIKNNDNSDHLLESVVINVGIFKDDRRYDSKNDQ